MIPKTFLTALTATCLAVSSNASPCKVSSRTTTVASTETASTTEIASTATQTTEASSIESATTVTDTSFISDATTTIEFSTTEGSLTIDLTSTATESDAVTTIATTTDSTTTETTTAEPTTTAEDTTTAEPTTTAETSTTVEAPAGPTHIVNAGFEASSQSISPWSLVDTSAQYSVSVDTTESHEGQNSAHMSYRSGSTNFLRQPLQNIEAGVSYTMSAWILSSSTCPVAYLRCTFNDDSVVKSEMYIVPDGTEDSWQQMTATCAYSQAQVDAGNLFFYVGFYCYGSLSEPRIDTVGFREQ
ncbi:hypothetical protein FBEOM_9431 [Fusarium beomiforme]|uniref:CBM-cenC domain-containing protein n=1 Tax=Fusarium beomiforme TaxID=44412 RepID=A0A9P5DTJ4_9HYPO|nr:hypothetical protein FBEOM_9431 [Fusarium beomiforme]